MTAIPPAPEPMHIVIDGGEILADLACPAGARGLVIFCHGSGSSRLSLRIRQVAASLQAHALATLLLDLLTQDEEEQDRFSGGWRFDVALLARRVGQAVDWAEERNALRGLPVGLFGSSTGAAAALMAAAEKTVRVRALVSRGGRPDLAGDALPAVRSPVLLIVGGADHAVLELNRKAAQRLPRAELAIVSGAGHLFEEPGTLEQVADLAARWFTTHLPAGPSGQRVSP